MNELSALDVLKHPQSGDNSDITEAVECAINALEKQMPKKPIKKNPICYSKSKDGEEHYAYDYYCSQCGANVNKESHHCPCGQALDWSDNK